MNRHILVSLYVFFSSRPHLISHPPPFWCLWRSGVSQSVKVTYTPFIALMEFSYLHYLVGGVGGVGVKIGLIIEKWNKNVWFSPKIDFWAIIGVFLTFIWGSSVITVRSNGVIIVVVFFRFEGVREFDVNRVFCVLDLHKDIVSFNLKVVRKLEILFSHINRFWCF